MEKQTAFWSFSTNFGALPRRNTTRGSTTPCAWWSCSRCPCWSSSPRWWCAATAAAVAMPTAAVAAAVETPRQPPGRKRRRRRARPTPKTCGSPSSRGRWRRTGWLWPWSRSLSSDMKNAGIWWIISLLWHWWNCSKYIYSNTSHKRTFIYHFKVKSTDFPRISGLLPWSIVTAKKSSTKQEYPYFKYHVQSWVLRHVLPSESALDSREAEHIVQTNRKDFGPRLDWYM